MALKAEFAGSGVFVPVRVWSCPLHDEEQIHECDCEHCVIPRTTCELCLSAGWVDEIGADGKVVMRELSLWEQMLRQDYSTRDWGVSMLEQLMAVREAPEGFKIRWLED